MNGGWWLAALLAAPSASAGGRELARVHPSELQTPAPVGVRLGAQQTEDALTPVPVDDRRAQDCLERGLTWLAGEQRSQRDGTFPRAGGSQWVPVPLAALGALAFMGAGNAPDRGPFGAQVSAAVDYLLAHTDLNPTSPTHGYIASEGDLLSRMHGHGFATVALAMAATQSVKTPRGERVREALIAATALIEGSQSVEGGWYYEPTSGIEHENSVTVVLLQALRSARNVGIAVDSNRILRAVDYVGRCQNEGGAFRYMLDKSTPSSVALTAAGITTLDAAGRYDSPEVERALTSLWQQLGVRETERRVGATSFPHYERLYVALALWTRRDQRTFDRWYGPERERLIDSQAADGSWSDDQFGACYATAMNCLVLALPQQLLPLFER